MPSLPVTELNRDPVDRLSGDPVPFGETPFPGRPRWAPFPLRPRSAPPCGAIKRGRGRPAWASLSVSLWNSTRAGICRPPP